MLHLYLREHVYLDGGMRHSNYVAYASLRLLRRNSLLLLCGVGHGPHLRQLLEFMHAEEVAPSHILLVRHLIGSTCLHWTLKFASNWIFTGGIHTHNNGCRSFRGRPLFSLPLNSFKYFMHGARTEVGLERIQG